MIKLDIQERDGFLIMDDFPKNCIFNKVKTGCGATTIALTNDENYIIAVPTTELVINKCYPPKDKDGRDIAWKKSQIQAGVSPTNDRLFGLYIIRKSKFPQNPKRSVRFSGKRTKRSVQKRKARNTQKAETKVL